MSTEYGPQNWMKRILLVAGLYNIFWGLLAITIPQTMLGWFGVDASVLSQVFWQCIGMVIGVYGIGYLIASTDPYRHWAITLVGLLGKICGPFGFLFAAMNESLPWSFGGTILINDLIWWGPFAVILWGTIRFQHSLGSAHNSSEADDPIRNFRANTGERLDQLANQKPQLIVFLRHAGCTFCREAMADLAAQREKIEAAGCGIILVHVGEEEDVDFFEKYGLQDLPRIADPHCHLYRQFGLDLGNFWQLFGPQVWLRGLFVGFFRGHGIGALQGNSFQMPGVYLYHYGQILDGYLHELSSERPNYLDIVQRNITRDKIATTA